MKNQRSIPRGNKSSTAGRHHRPWTCVCFVLIRPCLSVGFLFRINDFYTGTESVKLPSIPTVKQLCPGNAYFQQLFLSLTFRRAV